MGETLPKLFLCHATEDKVPFVRDLAQALSGSFNVWYDEYSLPPGASIFQSISAGLAQCDFGIVVLSKPFFGKKWTQGELGGLFARESANHRRIIPIWKEITLEDVIGFSPILADRRAVNANEGIPAVVCFIAKAIEMAARKDGFVHTGTVLSSYSSLGKKIQAADDARMLAASGQGAQLVLQAQNRLFDLVQQQLTRINADAPNLALKHQRCEYQCFPNNQCQLNVERSDLLTLNFEATRPCDNSTSGAKLVFAIFRVNRNRRDSNHDPICLEERNFKPIFIGGDAVAWQTGDGMVYDAQQLCDFALQRFQTELGKALTQ
jgi:hypothetical protein